MKTSYNVERWCWLMAVLLLGAACSDGTLSPVGPPPSFMEEDCETQPVDDCQEEFPRAPTGVPLMGIKGDLRTWESYEPDPSPNAHGLWLGSAVSPSRCFLTSYNESIDDDRDLLRDSCEFSLARSFAPLLQFAAGEPCGGGEPYWGATPLINDKVTIAYLLAYYEDCLPVGGHEGDSEYAQVTVGMDYNTGHWVVNRVTTLAHGHPNITGAANLTYPVRHKAFPQFWIAYAKHATYPSDDCHILGGGSGVADHCSNNSNYLYRVDVKSYRNVGAANSGGRVNALPCQRSVWWYPTGRQECFFSERRSFRGWQPSGSGVTPYYDTLMAHFYSAGPVLRVSSGNEDNDSCDPEEGMETEECINDSF